MYQRSALLTSGVLLRLRAAVMAASEGASRPPWLQNSGPQLQKKEKRNDQAITEWVGILCIQTLGITIDDVML